MRIWAATRDMDKIIKEVVMDFPAAHSEDEWNAVLGDICHELDLSRPVLLKKHLNELNTFRTPVQPANADSAIFSIDCPKAIVERLVQLRNALLGTLGASQTRLIMPLHPEDRKRRMKNGGRSARRTP